MDSPDSQGDWTSVFERFAHIRGAGKRLNGAGEEREGRGPVERGLVIVGQKVQRRALICARISLPHRYKDTAISQCNKNRVGAVSKKLYAQISIQKNWRNRTISNAGYYKT